MENDPVYKQSARIPGRWAPLVSGGLAVVRLVVVVRIPVWRVPVVVEVVVETIERLVLVILAERTDATAGANIKVVVVELLFVHVDDREEHLLLSDAFGVRSFVKDLGEHLVELLLEVQPFELDGSMNQVRNLGLVLGCTAEADVAIASTGLAPVLLRVGVEDNSVRTGLLCLGTACGGASHAIPLSLVGMNSFKSHYSIIGMKCQYRIIKTTKYPVFLRGICNKQSYYEKEMKVNYASSTVAPASSRSFFAASASSLPTFSLIALGTLSTRALASPRPRPVSSLTALITATF